LIPDINARFHTGDGLIRLKLNAVAEAAVTFGKGLKIVSQVMAPIYYEYHKEIAEIKMPDLNASNIESAMSMVKGTARSMGITVEG